MVKYIVQSDNFPFPSVGPYHLRIWYIVGLHVRIRCILNHSLSQRRILLNQTCKNLCIILNNVSPPLCVYTLLYFLLIYICSRMPQSFTAFSIMPGITSWCGNNEYFCFWPKIWDNEPTKSAFKNPWVITSTPWIYVTKIYGTTSKGKERGVYLSSTFPHKGSRKSFT